MALGEINCGKSDSCKAPKYIQFNDGKLSIIAGANSVFSFCLNKKIPITEYQIKETILNVGEIRYILQNEPSVFIFLFVDYEDLTGGNIFYKINGYNDSGVSTGLSNSAWHSIESYFFADPHVDYPITDLVVKNTSSKKINLKVLIVNS